MRSADNRALDWQRWQDDFRVALPYPSRCKQIRQTSRHRSLLVSDSDKDLIQVLLDNKVIGEAQAQVALKDQEMTGMPLDEVLIARRWVTRETLLQHAPWLNE